MENNRRGFLKIAGISALGLGAGPFANNLFASGPSVPSPIGDVSAKPTALKAERWAMVVDVKALLKDDKYKKCIEVCHSIHNVPNIKNKKHEIKWIWEDTFEHVFPEQEYEHLPEALKEAPFMVLCNHCAKPACVRACPTKATFQRDDGIVLMDFHRCIGCRFCMAACPYGSRSFNFRDPRPFLESQNVNFPTRMKGVVEKCNFCAERLANGQMPACVEVSEGAILFGDLHDPNSEVSQKLNEEHAIRRKTGLGSGPQIYYIV